MRILTAIDLAGIRAIPLGKSSYQMLCPWCGEEAWASGDYMQCRSASCEIQVASPEDVLAKFLGGYKQAEQFTAKHLQRPVDFRRAITRKQERAVMDLWLKFCTTPGNSETIRTANRLQESGVGVRQSRFNASVLDSNHIQEIMKLAEKTGASFPDSWLDNPPGTSMVTCVQSRPHTIDRLVIHRGRGRSAEIIWNQYSSGFCGLIGLSIDRPRLLVTDLGLAMKLQHHLAAKGQFEEIASIYHNVWSGGICPHWDAEEHLLTACLRLPEPCNSEMMYGPDDAVDMQRVLSHYPVAGANMRATTIESVMDGSPRDRHMPWHRMRFAIIASLIGSKDIQMPPQSATLFERTGTKREDAAALIARFRDQGRTQLASDIERLAMTRVIKREKGNVIRETANEYQHSGAGGVTLIANFSLKVEGNVSFDNRAEAYCKATLRCGSLQLPVMFPQTLLRDRIHGLQDSMQMHISSGGKTTTTSKLPTIIQSRHFRNYIMPFLRAEVADAKTVKGVDRLGWSADRKSYSLPGRVIDAEGTHRTGTDLYPGLPLLQVFESRQTWATAFPGDLDASCLDLVAMIIASCVRHFRCCSTGPMFIKQSAAAGTAVTNIMRSLGQKSIYEINQNVRSGFSAEGVFGYPVMVTGARTATADSQTPFLHLTESGYELPTVPTASDATTAGRALQFALQRVARWCVETGAEDFQEIKATLYHRSLIQEGKWLLRNVCAVEVAGEQSSSLTALERLLSQIPLAEAGRRMTLIDGQDLVIDLHGLKHDHDEILREGRDIGTIIAIEDEKLMTSAARLVPAISTFYGQDPDMTVLVTP